MIGAIIGDIVGSRFEFDNTHTKDFELFTDDCTITDDTVLTIAVGDAIKESGEIPFEKLVAQKLHWWGNQYNDLSYGVRFLDWLSSDHPNPYNSWGNGAAMRVSACADMARTLDTALLYAQQSARCTHNHPEGIKGATCVAELAYLAKCGENKQQILRRAKQYYEIPTSYKKMVGENYFSEACQVTVPQAIACFLWADSFEDTIRTAVSIGGDSDTIAAISGSIAEHYYGVPTWMKDRAMSYLDDRLRDILKSLICYQINNIGV